MSLADRWNATVADVERVCAECGRDPHDVKIIAVSKTVEAPVIAEALACGMTDFGENRTVPFNEKRELYPQANWHMIGQLQSRKAKEVVGRAVLIHSLDRPSLLQAIQKCAAGLSIVQDVLIEVNVSGEQSKGGIAPAELDAFAEQILQCPNVRCRGLMTMAPIADDDVCLKVFSDLRELALKLSVRYPDRDTIEFNELSMGMSQDYALAIREGATMVRIGRRIFSEQFGN